MAGPPGLGAASAPAGGSEGNGGRLPAGLSAARSLSPAPVSAKRHLPKGSSTASRVSDASAAEGVQNTDRSTRAHTRCWHEAIFEGPASPGRLRS